MQTFLLIHGSWHGAWCWYKVAPRLRAAGHQTIVPDLPGRGRHPRWAATIGLQTMVRAVARKLPENARVTVVVHSRYGVLASALAELVPDKIRQTIYLASFMLANGKRVLDYLPDHDSALNGHVDFDRARLSDRLRPEAYRTALYADCNDDDVDLAHQLLTREPSRPALARLRLSEERYGRVPRAYIRLTQDRAVSIGLQDRLLQCTPVDRVESLRASHSAYFSKPDALTSMILKLAT